MKTRTKIIPKATVGGVVSDISKITQEGLASLGKMGTAGKIAELGITFLDPTGITGWEALGEAATLFSKEKTAANFGKLVLAGLGALPATGTVTKLLGKSKSAVKGAEEISDVSKVLKETKKLGEGVEESGKLLRTTGATASISPQIIKAIDKLRLGSSDARRDKDLADLSELLHTAARNNEQLPKEFVQYLNSIFKTPVMERKLGEFTGKVKMKPTYTFKNPGDQQNAIEQLKVAAQSINKDTKEFKFTEQIRDSIYAKTKSYVQSFADNSEATKVFRKHFNDTEVPEIMNYQTSPEITQLFTKEQLAGPHGDFYRMGEEIAAKQRELRRDLSQTYGTDVRFVPVYQVNRGGYKLVPKRVYNAASKKWETRKDLVFLDKNGQESLTPIEGVHDYFVKGYAPSVNGTPLMEHIITDVEQHHTKPLSQWMADAILRVPGESDPKKLLEAYLEYRPEDYFKQYVPLLKENHIGTYAGIHSRSALSLTELTRIKGFARSLPKGHAVKDSEYIIDYLVKTKSQQEVQAVLNELKPIQTRIEKLQAQLERLPNNETFKKALADAQDQYLKNLSKYSREFENTTEQKITALKKMIETAPEREISDYEKLGKSLRGGFEKVWLESVTKEFSDAELGKIGIITEQKLLQELKQYGKKPVTLFSVDDVGTATYDMFRGDSKIGYVNGTISKGTFVPSYVKSEAPSEKGIFERGINSVVQSGYKYRTGDRWVSPEIQSHVITTRFTNPKGTKVVSNKGSREYTLNDEDIIALERELETATGDEYQRIQEMLDRGTESIFGQPVYLISKRSNKKGTTSPVSAPIVRHRYIPSLDRVSQNGLRPLIDHHLYKSGGTLISKKFNISSL